MVIVSIDPGTTESAIVELLPSGNVGVHGIHRNEHIVEMLCDEWPTFPHPGPPTLAVEMIASYGMAVGKEVFETCLWIGRFIQAWDGQYEKVYRKDVKLHLCGTPRAKDANIRQALIDRYGPGKDVAIGKKASPGPLYGFKSHMWAALAAAVTEHDRRAAL